MAASPDHVRELADRLLGEREGVRLLLSEAWATADGVHVRGGAFLRGRHLEAAVLARALAAEPGEWPDRLSRLNGNFAVVATEGHRLVAAVDRVRGFPLFHARRGETLLVGDEAERIGAAAGCDLIDDGAAEEFRLTGYVTGSGTLLEGLQQIPAGGLLVHEAGTRAPPRIERWYRFEHRDFLEEDDAGLIERLHEVHAGVFARLAASAGGRPVVVPLSGGYDSRLIGVGLREAGVREVLCYTYGLPGNWESEVSRALARHLGYRWELVPYSPRRWREWGAGEDFHEYVRRAGNLVSVPHVQDWPAVRELRAAGLVEPGSVIVPGHTGDFLTGNHIPRWFAGRSRVSRRALLDAIETAHYRLWPWPAGNRGLRGRLDARIEAVIGPLGEHPPEAAADLYERWELEERQAKFICNSLRVYEFFDCEWRLPLYDHELMDFWCRVPLPGRLGRRLFLDYAEARWHLPVPAPNIDRGYVGRAAIAAVDALRLRPLAKAAQRLSRRVRWRREYERPHFPPLGWYGLIDRGVFGRTYSGMETLHSYMAAWYHDEVTGRESGCGRWAGWDAESARRAGPERPRLNVPTARPATGAAER